MFVMFIIGMEYERSYFGYSFIDLSLFFIDFKFVALKKEWAHVGCIFCASFWFLFISNAKFVGFKQTKQVYRVEEVLRP